MFNRVLGDIIPECTEVCICNFAIHVKYKGKQKTNNVHHVLIVIAFLGQGDLLENEKLNFDAITKIHSHLDDDRNGKVDLSESNEVSVYNAKHVKVSAEDCMKYMMFLFI